MDTNESAEHYDELSPVSQLTDGNGILSRVTDLVNLVLSHHSPEQYGHCLRIGIGHHTIHLCGRCTGIYGGLIIGLLGLIILNPTLEPSWLWFGLAVILGMTTVVDWMTQRLTPRKTTVHVRFVTGLASGVSLAIIFVLSNVFYILIAMLVMIGSVSLVGLIQSRS